MTDVRRASSPDEAVPLRLATRGSALALAQSGLIADAIRRNGVAIELVVIRTAGDERAPDTAWGEGAFVGAIEAALLAGTADLAVHSAKDVPTDEDPRLAIAAFTEREDPRDALVSRIRGLTLATLPRGARLGTDSPRRTAFLLDCRPDLDVRPLHGNVDTRLRKLDAGEADALVLAAAGLRRLGRGDRIDEILAPTIVAPAPGQGALAVQCRCDDARTRSLLARLDHRPTRVAVEAERAFLAASGGGCRAPLGILGTVEDGVLRLSAMSARAAAAEDGWDGRSPIRVDRGEESGPESEAATLAVRLAERLRPAESKRGPA